MLQVEGGQPRRLLSPHRRLQVILGQLPWLHCWQSLAATLSEAEKPPLTQGWPFAGQGFWNRHRNC